MRPPRRRLRVTDEPDVASSNRLLRAALNDDDETYVDFVHDDDDDDDDNNTDLGRSGTAAGDDVGLHDDAVERGGDGARSGGGAGPPLPRGAMVVRVGSLSKSFGLAGWRVGYVTYPRGASDVRPEARDAAGLGPSRPRGGAAASSSASS